MTMYLIGTMTLGADARTFPSQDGQKTYASVTGWWTHGRGDDAAFQWADLKLLSLSAGKVAPMLTKGKQIQVVVANPHVEVYQPKDQSREPHKKIVGILERFDFVGPRNDAPARGHDVKRAASEPQGADDDGDIRF